MKRKLISDKILDFYNQSSEEDRLGQGLGPFEFERNKDLIERYLPEPGAMIADIGGGTGKYAAWLASQGHQVVLVDPVEKHISQAQKRAKRAGQKFDALLGEARNLDIPDGSVDLVILHGPLYHLQDYDDRMKALSEASRILKPEGTVLGFAINYTASTFVALLQGVLHEPHILNMCRSELMSSMHDAPENMPGVLTEAFYHRPEQLKAEFENARFSNLVLYAVEGIVWLEKNFFSVRGDQTKYKNLIELLKITEKDLNLIAMSPHMMIAGRK
ncbi:MAG: class I SAM-dependent methyltransferase [Bacteroidota bacterium]